MCVLFRLEISEEQGNEVWLNHLAWIPNFQNLCKLVANEFVLEDSSSDLKVFYKNPLKNLKHFEIGRTPAFYCDQFLMKMYKTFPNLETLIIIDYTPDFQDAQGCWSSVTLLGILSYSDYSEYDNFKSNYL